MGLFSWIRAQHSERKAARADGSRRHHYYRRRYRTTRRSVRSDDTEYFSADEQDVSGGSPRPPGIAEERPFDAPRSGPYYSDDDGVVADGDKIIVQPDRRGSGCLNQLGATRSGKRLVLSERPSAGNSFGRRSAAEDTSVAANCFEQPEATSYMVRGIDYLRTRKKVSSDKAIMQLLTIDAFATDFKLYHIARHMDLPTVQPISDEATARGFVPLLIVNMQMPLYNPGYFGTHDGQGGSLIYFFCFPPGWHPDSVSNPAALKLLEAFFNDNLCADGTPARERLKLIPRVSNVDEWARAGPLSATEHRMLTTYNDKPVLTRPQQRFYRGPGYLEVDLDVHTWNFIARKAFFNYIPKLSTVVFENAFVIQGNEVEELPEQVLGCVRVFRVNFGDLDRTHRFPLKPDDGRD